LLAVERVAGLKATTTTTPAAITGALMMARAPPETALGRLTALKTVCQRTHIKTLPLLEVVVQAREPYDSGQQSEEEAD
jgi:hypothetical protein